MSNIGRNARKEKRQPVSQSEDQTIAIPAAAEITHTTLRATVPALEARLYQAVPLLDHGFVRVIDYMGDDHAIVQAARVSYGRGTKKVSEDTGLIRYLMRHRHTTPFEMCDIKFHVKLPIFVARQWIRHRMASVNEYSARYSVMDREFYIPEPAQLAAQSTLNRQGRETVLAGEEAARVLALLRSDAERAYEHYEWMLNEGSADNPADPARIGLARELARMNLTLNTYTQWYLEDEPAQPLPLPVAARRQARPVRNPRLCRSHAGYRGRLGSGRRTALSLTTAWER